MIEDLLRKILDHSIEKYLKPFIGRELRENEITVHEFIGCKRKMLLLRNLPELEYSISINPRIVLGELIHLGILKILGKRDEKIVYKDIILNNKRYRFIGMIDAIINNSIIDFKFTLLPSENLPSEKHVLQVKMYMWLTGLEEGYLLYFTPNEILEYKIDEKLSDEDIKRLYEHWDSPRYSWECDYCSVKRYCELKYLRKGEEVSEETSQESSTTS
ncbi:MAG: hypothetical protein DRJ45_04480 [Thermoprotei archaeon]|nr:MAG: hypothetical protein DRJ45_04480 [Thermoprotei archaeon]